MLSEVTLEVALMVGNTTTVKGLSVSGGRQTGNTIWTQSQGCGDNLNGRRAGGITSHPRGVYERAFNPRDVWEGPPGRGYCCQPDSGNPTVRDERGACGNVNYGGTRDPLHNRKGAGRKLSTYRCARRTSTRQPPSSSRGSLQPARTRGIRESKAVRGGWWGA